MKKVEISYNPFKMTTTMMVEGIDVCKHPCYDGFKEFVEQRTPLQSWIEPLPYMDWPGIVNALVDPEINDEIKVYFSGRKIDFEDLKRSIAIQNAKRNERAQVKFCYVHKKVLDDKQLSKNIEEVVQELKSDRFRALINSRKTSTLIQKYQALEDNYRIAKESEFYICLAGVYSSGKSTLLNTLIRHNVLTTYGETCTRMNCRIKHNKSLGKRVALTGYGENGKVVVERRIFDDDSVCAKEFERISPADASVQANVNVSLIELEADLTHLYPESVSDDKFTIVLIDTPGMDSAQSSKYGKNAHAEIAMDAISMESKPMIILCVDEKCESESIGRFMREIVAQSKEDGGGFNDRFLFLINKCDKIEYTSTETAEAKKHKLAQYLLNPSKWGIKADEEELKKWAEDASHFVPRIFMTSAGVAFAIQCGADQFTDEELEDGDKLTLCERFEDFNKKICGRRPRSNFFLSRLCDNPQHRKDQIEAEFQAARERGDETRATELQCGIISVETAIKDYIERYAYPIKVRGLLETFDDILEDVNSFTSAILSALKAAEKDLGEKSGERKGVESRREASERKIAALEDSKKKIEEQLKELDKIQFDSVSLKRAISGFRADIESNGDVSSMRSQSRVNTGQKSRGEVEREIKELIVRIRALFKSTLKETNAKLNDVKQKHDEQMNSIFRVLDSIVRLLESSGVLNHGQYRFENTVFWNMLVKNLDSHTFESDMEKNVVDKKDRPRNWKKMDWSSSWNPFKRIASWFMDDYDYSVEPKDGYYDTTPIKKQIDEYLYNLTAESNKMELQFVGKLNERKTSVRSLINKLLLELVSFHKEVEEQEKRIDELSTSLEDLAAEISKCKKEQAWLDQLCERIKGV